MISIANKLRFVPRPIHRMLFTTPMRLDTEMNDPFEHATGLEKRELAAEREGNHDPWHFKTVLNAKNSTKECPVLVPSAYEGRMIGCICNEDQRWINYMWVEENCPKRCECGYWFKLKKVKPFNYDDDHH